VNIQKNPQKTKEDPYKKQYVLSEVSILVVYFYKMKGTYTLIFIGGIALLTLLVVLALYQISSTHAYSDVDRTFRWLTGAITFCNFSITTLLLVMAHLLIYRKGIRGAQVYILIALPYVFFILFTLINYVYIYDLYNIYQTKNLVPIDTPEMPVFALNVALFAAILGAINLAVVWGFDKK